MSTPESSGSRQDVGTNFEYGLNIVILKNAHDFNANSLSANQAFPDISKSSTCYLLTNFLHLGKSKASRMETGNARETTQGFEYQWLDDRKGIEIQKLIIPWVK
jgi:hypothetical protein